VARPKNYNFSHQKTFWLAQVSGGLEKQFFENIASNTSEIFTSKTSSRLVLLSKI